MLSIIRSESLGLADCPGAGCPIPAPLNPRPKARLHNHFLKEHLQNELEFARRRKDSLRRKWVQPEGKQFVSPAGARANPPYILRMQAQIVVVLLLGA